MGLAATKVSATFVGGCEILEKLGKGGTGTVYRARMAGSNQAVALKVISGDVVSDPVQRMRFAQECQITRQLNHPHIVRVLDFGIDGAKAYMVMEHVEGTSLGGHLEEHGPIEEGEAVRLIGQVGEALQYAHERRLIHRDVTPENILLTSDGDAKLTNLGVVKNLESDFELTRTRTALGTPNFMAPEQFEDPRCASPRSDLYSLAATLYVMVTGTLPFRARSAAAVAAIYKKQLANDIVPPSSIVPGLSEVNEAAILRALRADPKERHADVAAFLAALQHPASLPADGDAAELTEVAETVLSFEQRRQKRYDCLRPATCQPFEGKPEDIWGGDTVNISEGGLCLELPRRFEPGALLTVVLGDGPQSHSRVIRVAWVKQVETNLWRVGGQYDYPLCDFEVDEMRDEHPALPTQE